jgi:hypothetical protein
VPSNEWTLIGKIFRSFASTALPRANAADIGALYEFFHSRTELRATRSATRPSDRFARPGAPGRSSRRTKSR